MKQQPQIAQKCSHSFIFSQSQLFPTPTHTTKNQLIRYNQQLPSITLERLRSFKTVYSDDQSDLTIAIYDLQSLKFPVYLKKTRLENAGQKLKRIISQAYKQNYKYLAKNYGCNQNEKYFSYTLQFMDVGTLQQLIIFHSRYFKNKLIESVIGQICFQILKGLEQIKTNQLSSLFLLCPHNIGLNKQGQVKLMYFQINQNLDRNIRDSDFYLSPEKIKGNNFNQSEKGHTWALGLILYQLATNTENLFDESQINFNSSQHKNCCLKKDIMSKIELLLSQKLLKRVLKLKKENQRSIEFCNFVERCLQIEERKRANIEQLLVDPWLTKYKQQNNLPQFLNYFTRMKSNNLNNQKQNR